MTERPSITAIILAFNEEIHIARCIERLQPLARRIIVIDSFSTDGTVDIARGLGAEVHQHAFTNQAAQLQWAIDAIAIDTNWILRIDADEYLEPGLIAELSDKLPALGNDVAAIDFKLKVLFRGRWIRWGGYYRTVLTRMWRPGRAHMEQRWMDERLLVSDGRTIRLSGGDLVDDNLKDIGWWTDKHNHYATRQMIDFVTREHNGQRVPEHGALTASARVSRLMRGGYASAPLYLRAVLYFAQRYVLRLGFLDGRAGFVWHFLQGFWYFVLIDAKIDEARGFIRAHGFAAFPQYVSDRYGMNIEAERR